MKGKLVHLLLILVCFMLQGTLMKSISIGSICPNLILILCVSIGLMRGRKSGMWTGFLSGLLIDMFYGSVFGFYALVYMYIGFLSGYAHRVCYDDDLKVPVMLALAADLLYGLGVYALQFLLRGRLGLSVYFVRIILPEMLYTVLLMLIIYRVFYFINYHFMAPVRQTRDSVWVIR